MRRLALALLALVAGAASAAAAGTPTLHFRSFTKTDLPLGQVLWTGSGIPVRRREHRRDRGVRPARHEPRAVRVVRQGGEEMRCATSLGKPWWPAGIYCHTPDNRIIHFSPDGS